MVSLYNQTEKGSLKKTRAHATADQLAGSARLAREFGLGERRHAAGAAEPAVQNRHGFEASCLNSSLAEHLGCRKVGLHEGSSADGTVPFVFSSSFAWSGETVGSNHPMTLGISRARGLAPMGPGVCGWGKICF